MMRLCCLTELFIVTWYITFMSKSAAHEIKPCKDAAQHALYTTEGLKCCPHCPKDKNDQPCKEDAGSENNFCRCAEGYGCASTSCVTCIEILKCDTDQRLKRINTNGAYHYSCENCPNGTFLEMLSGECKKRPITTTEENRNKSTVLAAKTSAAPTASPSSSITPLVLFSVSVMLILLFITITVHVLIWKLKAAKVLKAEADQVPPHVAFPMIAKGDGDTWSCQYPEEEHGDRSLNKLAAC
ncbi:tumor necrosis factor receptor superfamily member 18 [Hyperolius riggenbachi]|uniref:tumor necrosis factor receptor superfamily member 18 n=1 Tax=Hyperolius riggenbachi TaxID=752182 RepID=UPI0035A3AABC